VTCRGDTRGRDVSRPGPRARTRRQDAFRLTILRKVSSILDCHPSPVALKCSITSRLKRSDTSFFVGALFGPRPFRKRWRDRERLPQTAWPSRIGFRQFRIIADVAQILLAIAGLFLAFGILFPFILASADKFRP